MIFCQRAILHCKDFKAEKKKKRRKHNILALYKLTKKFVKCICVLKQKHNLHCQYELSSVGNTCFQTIEKGKRKQFSPSLPNFIGRLKVNAMPLRVCRVAMKSAKKLLSQQYKNTCLSQ